MCMYALILTDHNAVGSLHHRRVRLFRSRRLLPQHQRVPAGWGLRPLRGTLWQLQRIADDDLTISGTTTVDDSEEPVAFATSYV